MIYRRKTYKIQPENLDQFNEFFLQYLLPNQLKHGAKLVGRWVSEDQSEIEAIWEYESLEVYHRIEGQVRNDDLHARAQEKRQELGELYIESKQDFLQWAGPFRHPKHIVAVSGYITNDDGEVLLVRNHDRADTWEMPGGQVEEFEAIDEAVKREILEETGANIQLTGLTGLYHGLSRDIVCIVFWGKYTGGKLRPQESEIKDVDFFNLDQDNIKDYITRPHHRSRCLDAMAGNSVPYESFKVRPYDLINRIEATREEY